MELLFRPKGVYKKKVGIKINNHNYARREQNQTNEFFFEEIFEMINQNKNVVKKGFVSFKGVTDEMNTFGNIK